MNRILLLLLLLTGYANAQTWQPTSIRQRFVNGIGIPTRDTVTGTAADSSQFVLRPQDSVIYYKYKGYWRKVGTGAITSIAWDSITGKPVNFPTTYALSNDVKDSIQSRVTNITRIPGKDSIIFYIGTNRYAIKDSIGGSVTSVGLSMPSAFAVSSSPITTSGTIAVTGAGNATQYVRGDGTLATLPTNGGGGGASVSYYLNGSVNQGTFAGNTYYEMNKTPIIGAGTDFSRSSNGYIASFLTDAGDPALLNIPGGNWNFETYFKASSGGGSPTFYIELYKYDGTTFTLIASNSGSPKLINDGTNIEAYFSTLAVPQTTLTLTDRLAVRIYVTTVGRTIELHTENGHLCQVITTFTTGLTALNGLTSQVQYLAVGTSGTDFNISSATDTHTFNLPTASATNRGALSAANWTMFNNKQNALSLTTTGAAGSSTLIGSTLNVPTYTLSGLGGQPQLNGTGFVKASGTTISYDNNTYYLASNPNGYTSNTGTVTSIATTAPLTGGTITTSGTLGITQATTSTSGFLSSTDWNTFNGKQNALTNPVTGTGTANNVALFTGTSTIGNSVITQSGSTVGINAPTINTNASLDIQANNAGVVLSMRNRSASGYAGVHFFNSDNTLVGHFGWGNATAFNLQNNLYFGSLINAPLVLTTNDVERMRITSGGNVGIGTTSPTYALHVNSNNPIFTSRFYQPSTSTSYYNAVDFSAANTAASGYISLGGSTVSNISLRDAFGLGTSTSSPLIFLTSDAERMRITSAGNLLIGTTTDDGTNKLQVTGSIKSTSLAGTGERLVTADANGKLQISTTSSTVTSGTYTPTATSAVNATLITCYTSPYTRIGNVISMTVSGNFTATSANTATRFNLNIPVAAISLGGAVLYGTGNISNSTNTQISAASITATTGATLGFNFYSYPTTAGVVQYFTATIQYTLQ